MLNRIYTVYKGELNNTIVYIGTTVQVPKDRFRWHKANGKDFKFTVLFQFDNEMTMLDVEFELIKQYKPKFNKLVHRKQNLNIKLTDDIINSRKGDKCWCQKCLKRRVTMWHTYCYWCS